MTRALTDGPTHAPTRTPTDNPAHTPTQGGDFEAPRAPHHPLRAYRLSVGDRRARRAEFVTEPGQFSPDRMVLP